MDTKDFVSFETASSLADNGYRVYSKYHYFIKDIEIGENGFKIFKEKLTDINLNGNYNNFKIYAPTLWEASKWLRDKENIFVDVGLTSDYSVDADGNTCDMWYYWTYNIYFTTNIDHVLTDCDIQFKTYEEALDYGIRDAVKFLSKL